MNEQRLYSSNQNLCQSFVDLKTVVDGESSSTSSITTGIAATTFESNFDVNSNSLGNDIFYVSPPKRKDDKHNFGDKLDKLYYQTFNKNTYSSTNYPLSRCNSYNHNLANRNIKYNTPFENFRSANCIEGANSINRNIAHDSLRKSSPQAFNRTTIFQNNVKYMNEQFINRNMDYIRFKRERSLPSLCSCDINIDKESETKPFNAGALNEYSLDRHYKTHTYTCEQNANILRRLASERRNKNYLSIDSHHIKTLDQNTMHTDASCTSDTDKIPPIPPPPSKKLKKYFPQMQQTRAPLVFPHETIRNFSNNSNLKTGNNKVCDVKSRIGDYRTCISKCANAIHMNLNSALLFKTLDSNSSRKTCPVKSSTILNCNTYLDQCTCDDIFFPNCSKYNQSQCFLKIGPKNSKRNYTRYNNFDNDKFYTISSSGYNENKISEYSKIEHCNCFSQSLSSLSNDIFRKKRDNQNDFVYQTEGKQNVSDNGFIPTIHHKCKLDKNRTIFKTSSCIDLKNINNSYKENICPLYQSQHNNFYTNRPSKHLLQGFQKQSILQNQKSKYNQLYSNLTNKNSWINRHYHSRSSLSSISNTLRFDAAKHWLAVSSILLIIGAASVAVPLALRITASAPYEERLRVAEQLLDQVPLIDGHNDLPWNIRKFLHNKLNEFNFDEDLRNIMPWAKSHWSHTDLKRLKKGRISAQFWAAYVPCEAQHRDAVQVTLEQIDVIKRLTDRYSPQLTSCFSSEDIITAQKHHQLCSLIGVEGGHSLGNSLAVLRTLYTIGVRYLTLTSTCHTPWADSSFADAPTFNVKHGGLTIFGKKIIREMNRLGMMVDLSHVSTGTMSDALETSEAPVIFSHSSAYHLCNSSRNVQDQMLKALSKNGGLVMVNFYSKFLSCSENSTIKDAVAHINHIRNIAGIDHVGLGAGYDGINYTPKGLDDVSTYPTLFAELLGVGWSIDELTKLAGGNFLRVMQKIEKLRDEKKAEGVKPFEDHPNFRTDDPYNCTSS